MKPSFRCSELDRVLTCHASKILGDRFKHEDESGPAAWEGNWCHWTAARHLVDHEGAEIGDGGLPDEPECGDFKPNPFSQWVVDYFIGELDYAIPGMGIIVEDELIHEFAGFTLTGHADVLAFDGTGEEAIGYDLKAGAIPVDAAAENNQMLGYMALVCLCYPSVRKITWRICQPKNRPDDGYERVSEVTLEGDEITAAIDYLEGQLNTVLKTPYFIDSEANQGAQCKYCPAALRCPALKHDLIIMKATLTEQQITEIGPDLDLNDLVLFEDCRKKFATPFDKARQAIIEKLKDNDTMSLDDGRTISVTSRPGRRSCTDPVGAYSKLREQQFEAEIEAQCVTVKLGEVEDAVAKARGIKKTSKKDENAKDVVKVEFGPYFQQGTTYIINVN